MLDETQETAAKSKIKNYLTTATEGHPVWFDQDHIAYIRRGSQGRRLMSFDFSSGSRTVLADEELRIGQLFAAGDGSLYMAMDMSGSECEQIYRYIDGQFTVLTTDKEVRHLVGGVSRDGRWLAYACNKRQSQSFDIWRMDLQSGDNKLVQPFEDHYNWPASQGLSADGRYLLYNKLKSELDNALWLTDLNNGNSRRVPDDTVVSSEVNPVWLSDGTGFYLLSNRNSEYHNLWYYDLAAEEMTLVSELSCEAEQLALSADDRYLAVFANRDGYSELHILDRRQGIEINTIRPPRGVYSLYQTAAWSPVGHRLAFSITSGRRPEELWLLNLDTESLFRLTDDEVVSPEQQGNNYVEPVLRHFNSFDGLKVPYWLYVPTGREARDLPVLIKIHGGPEGQERPGFNEVLQYLLSEGIAVVAPNVRGSNGYGKTYLQLDDVEKRLDSVRDIDSLVQHLIADGIADRTHIGVAGTSYGGFMTLSCAARYPHLWACAVDTVGMYNLVTFLENTADYRRAHRESEYGTLASDRETLLAVSPASKIEQITAPIMIIQGRNDPRVPVTEAEQAVDALRQRGREVTYLCYDGEGHGIAKMKNRLDCYPQVAAFLKKHLGID